MIIVWTIAVFAVIWLLGIGWLSVTHSSTSNLPKHSFKTKASLEGTSDIGILVHSFDGYRRYWPGFLYFYRKHYAEKTSSHRRWPLYFATEQKTPSKDIVPFRHIQTGEGSWGYRLRKALEVIPQSYVLYMQEDMWLNGTLSHSRLEEAWGRMISQNAIHWKLQTNCEHLVLCPTDYNDPKWYVASHQPAIWDKEFLLSTLRDNYSPFAHETRVNHALHTTPAQAALCVCDVGFNFPYVDVSRRGKLRPQGVAMVKSSGIQFEETDDQVYVRSNI